MYLKELEIRNFQSHVNSKFKFGPGVNVITGISQAGKTAIIRAMLLLFTNRPSGVDKYRHKYTDNNVVSVKGKFSDNTTVTIRKGDRLNQYILNDETFERFGASCPQEIQEALNLADINIQTQLESHFLITDSASQISKTINKITNLESGDKWIAEATRRINTVNVQKQQLQADIENLEEEYHVLDGIEEIPPLLNRIRQQSAKRDGLISQREAIQNQLQLLRVAKQKKNRMPPVNRINGVLDKLSEVMNLKAEAVQRRRALDVYTQHKARGLVLQKKLEKLKKMYIQVLKTTGKCPTCFSKVTAASIKRIKEAL
ncbi:MAG: hypothetical protein DRJ03_01000 [Chloroflexi bacterium]|nr:MAG: hypothetical protein DRJ03_01000 [Chloroflexota bacterium]